MNQVRFLNTKSGGLAILHACHVEGCIEPGVFGEGVEVQTVLKKIERKDIEGARISAGRWSCQQHRERAIP